MLIQRRSERQVSEIDGGGRGIDCTERVEVGAVVTDKWQESPSLVVCLIVKITVINFLLKQHLAFYGVILYKVAHGVALKRRLIPCCLCRLQFNNKLKKTTHHGKYQQRRHVLSEGTYLNLKAPCNIHFQIFTLWPRRHTRTISYPKEKRRISRKQHI